MYTQIKGDPTNRPTLKATSGFGHDILLDGYPNDGGYWNAKASTLNFHKSIENINIDSTDVNSGTSLNLLNWAVAQATSIHNVEFTMPNGSQHTGIKQQGGDGGGGSGTYMGDMVFNGGSVGMNMTNQQFHVKNCVFNSVTTIDCVSSSSVSVGSRSCTADYTYHTAKTRF
jgi:glucan 1,3-beta-glucosidase